MATNAPNLNPAAGATLAGQAARPAMPTNAAPPAPAARQTAPTPAPSPSSAPASPAHPPSGVGAMFRRILSLGLMSVAGELAAEGANGPGPAAATGIRTGIALRQQQFENQQATQREADTHTLTQADVAMDNLKMLQLGKQINLLPSNRAEQFWQEHAAPTLSRLIESGVYVPVGQTYDSYSAAFDAAHQLNMDGRTAEYMALPDPNSPDERQYIVVQNSNAPITEAMSIPNPLGGPAFVVPPGTPATAARKAAVSAMTEFQKQYAQQYAITVRATNQLDVATIRATAAEERERIRGYSARALSQSLSSIRKSEDDTQKSMAALNKQLSDPNSNLTPASQQQALEQYRTLQQRLGQLGVREQVEEDQLLSMTRGAEGSAGGPETVPATPAPVGAGGSAAPGPALAPSAQPGSVQHFPTPSAPNAPGLNRPALTGPPQPFDWNAHPVVTPSKRKGGGE